MSKSTSVAWCLSFFALVSVNASADEVVMRNGDRISGEVVRLEGGKLVFKTSYAGNVRIDWSQVSTLSTEQPVYLSIGEADHVQGTVGEAESGSATLSGGDWPGTRTLVLDQVTGLTREPEPEVKLSGRINVGFSSTSGNTDTQNIHTDAEVIARSATNRFTIGGALNRAQDSGVDTESNWIVSMKYDHFLSKKWYAYSNGEFEYDKFKDINLRTTIGVGSGYQIYETDITNLSLEGGVNYVNTDFDVGEDENYPAGRWGVNFDHFLFGSKTQFFHRDEGFFALDDSGNMFVRTRTGLRWPVIDRLAATAQYNVDWEENPAPGRTRTDRAVLFTLGYHW